MYLLDSNMISAYLKNIVRVVDKFDAIWYKKEPMFIDGIVYYEIKGGLLHVNARAKLRQFYLLLQTIPSPIFDLAIFRATSIPYIVPDIPLTYNIWHVAVTVLDLAKVLPMRIGIIIQRRL